MNLKQTIMKKSLLNYKSLHFAILLLLLCANSTYSQTILTETFGTTANASYTGGTSSPSVTYTRFNTTYNKISAEILSTETFLNFASLATSVTTQAASTTAASNVVTLTAANPLISVGQVVTTSTNGVLGSGVTTVTAINGTSLTLSTSPVATNPSLILKFIQADERSSLAGALPPENTGLKGNLQTNDRLISWTFNMKASRLSTNSFSSSTAYPAYKYFNGVVLCATSEGLLSNSVTPGTGYAVVLQKSSNNSISGKVSINLIKFSNGIGDAAAPESSVVTRLIESPELVQIPNSTTTSNNLSIKVTYNSSINVWELFYREDPTPSPFVDPSSGTPLLGGSYTDVPTTTPMTHFGFVAGLQSSSNAANTYQFDNFKIALSPLPAYTSPPTVEKRQAFNSTPTPKVIDLVAVGINGATFNWYDAPTGGNLLTPTTPLTYTNYYGSQTLNGTESTRVETQVFVGDTSLKTLPFHEDFADYALSDKLILMNNGASTSVATNNGVGLGSWTITPSSNISDDVTITTSPSWTNTVLPAASGNAITYAGSGIDPELMFTNTTSGNLYSSFVFSAVDVATIVAAAAPFDTNYSTPTGLYSFSSEIIDPVDNSVSTGYAADVMFRRNMTTGKFNIGLSKSNNGAECEWSSTEFDFGTQHVIVISYENIGDADSLSQTAKLWIDPETTTQPIATLSQNNPTTPVSRDHLDRIKILQASSSSTPTMIIDEIRVADNWEEVLGGTSLGNTTVNASQLKLYPNPVSNGKLYIASTTNLEKEVAIYNTLGQEVLLSKTNNQAINVSNLSKGTYFVKITEAGITATKKLIIQ